MLSVAVPGYEPVDGNSDPDYVPVQEVETLADLGDFLKLPKKK